MNHDPMLLRRILTELPRFTYRFANEVELHEGIASVLGNAGIAFEREVAASKRDRFDFLCASGIVLEAKVRGAYVPAMAQCVRYAELDSVSAVVLLTTRFWGGVPSLLPTSIYTGGRLVIQAPGVDPALFGPDAASSGKPIRMLKLKGQSF